MADHVRTRMLSKGTSTGQFHGHCHPRHPAFQKKNVVGVKNPMSSPSWGDNQQNGAVKNQECMVFGPHGVEQGPQDERFQDEGVMYNFPNTFRGRLQRGREIIEKNPIDSENLDSGECRPNVVNRLEKYTLEMLKADKAAVNATLLISDMVDEFANDNENEEMRPKETQLCNILNDWQQDEEVMFRTDMIDCKSFGNFRDKLSKIFGERYDSFREGLTDEILMKDQHFKDVQTEFQNGNKDVACQYESFVGAHGDGVVSRGQGSESDSSDEEDYTLGSTLFPCIDPISKGPIKNAITNKFCNHVFDQCSINKFIAENPRACCPVLGCRNKLALSPLHFKELKTTYY